MSKLNLEMVDKIENLRWTAAALNSRGRDPTRVDSELSGLYKDFPLEYAAAEKRVYAEIKNR